MDERKMELLALKKAAKKAKRRVVTPWKSVAIVCLVLCLLLTPISVAISLFDNTVAAFFGGTFWKLVNEDKNAIYYQMDFDTVEQMAEYGDALCQQVEAEGAVLLMNENNALPFEVKSKISCFSTSSVNLVYGGTGSGNIDASKADNLKTALEKVGFEVNPALWDFYTKGAGSKYLRAAGSGVIPKAGKVSEAPWSVYTDEVKNSVSAYGDAAVVVISRIGGEGYDLEFQETNYLALDQNERDMLQALADMKAAGTLEKIVVLINSANALQVDFLKDNPYHIDACLWIGDVGITGINAVAEILAGSVNPSGSLVDTYLYNNFSSPAMFNNVPTTYSNYTEGLIPENASTYMIYQEGIYVGYRYYETRYEDYVMGTGNAGNYAYRNDVAYPFGYGLSYTQFEYSDVQMEFNAETDQFEISVKVTNAGQTCSGKETIQVYSQSPYTEYDKINGVEKPAVALCGFAKTKILAPGESQTVKVYIDKRDLASFDSYGASTYILDDGEYYLTIGTDAHDAVNNTLAAKGYTVENTEGRMDYDGNAALACKWVQEDFDDVSYATSLNGTKITNQLDEADLNSFIGSESRVTYLSRNDWQGTFPKEIVKIKMTQHMIDNLQDLRYNPDIVEGKVMPTLGADNGLTLYDMIGLSYDDPKWESLLDQLTFDEMVSMIGDSFHWRMPVESVQAPGTRDENGPQGSTASLFGANATQLKATAFTSEDVMAATFNVELIYDVGRVIGNNCLAADVVCLYGPGANIHRTPYGGRNFEYYSEDGFLSGEIAAAEVKGIQDKGVDVVMKHFALNDCEQDRIGLGVWINEQAAREIYLKAFQKSLEESGGNGVMTAYTRWGTTWSGGYKNLMTNIMREEWGNQGMSITDNVLTTYTNGVDGILAGTTTFDAMLWYVTEQLKDYEKDAVVVSAMREAAHHNLYALANSSGMNGVGENTTVKMTQPVIIPITIVLAVVTGVGFAATTVMWVIANKKFKKTEEYLSYRTMRLARKAEKDEK